VDRFIILSLGRMNLYIHEMNELLTGRKRVKNNV
jgi:hypothetical protein